MEEGTCSTQSLGLTFKKQTLSNLQTVVGTYYGSDTLARDPEILGESYGCDSEFYKLSFQFILAMKDENWSVHTGASLSLHRLDPYWIGTLIQMDSEQTFYSLLFQNILLQLQCSLPFHATCPGSLK